MKIFVNVCTYSKGIIFFDEGKIWETVTWDEQGRESDWVLPTIASFLEKNDIDPSQEIDAIYAVTGPGSFTGIRVEVNTLNAMKYIYPSIDMYQMHMGDVMRSFQNDAKELLFQVYASDVFIFSSLGEFLRRSKVSDLDRTMYAGYVLPETKNILQNAYVELPEIGQWSREDLVGILEYAEKVEQLLPFYGKDANITTPKKI